MRLKKGAVPLLFPWVENVDAMNQKMDRRTDDKVPVINLGGSTPTSEKPPDGKDEVKNAPDIFSYEQLKCNDKLHVPTAWTRQVFPVANSEFTCFCKLVCGNVLDVNVVSQKQISIYSDLTFEAKIMGKHFDLGQYGFGSKLESLDRIEDALKLLDSLKVCPGSSAHDDTIRSSVSYVDSLNTLRHVKCNLVTDKRRCEFCTRLNTTLDQKRKRIDERGSKMKRIRLDGMNEDSKQFVQDILTDKNNLAKTVNRQKATIQGLRRRLLEIKKELEEYSESSLDHLLQLENIHPNERESLKTILQCAKVKSSKGRRYFHILIDFSA